MYEPIGAVHTEVEAEGRVYCSIPYGKAVRFVGKPLKNERFKTRIQSTSKSVRQTNATFV